MAIDKGALISTYGVNPAAPREAAMTQGNTMVAATSMREVQRVQAQFIMARTFPRDSAVSMARILDACARPGLADKAEYQYQRGKDESGKPNYVTGASIKLAEVMAQNWGNIDFGINELENSDGRSKVEAYCVDLETNTSRRVTYEVPHLRVTKTGSYKLTDPRDIYEMIANRGARLLRGCILGIIPGDVQEAALAVCKETNRKLSQAEEQKGKAKFQETVSKLLSCFNKLGVGQDKLVAIVGLQPSEWTTNEVEKLRPIYTTIKDGEGKIEDFLGRDEAVSEEPITEEQRQELMSLISINQPRAMALLTKAGLTPIKEIPSSKFEEAKAIVLEATAQ